MRRQTVLEDRTPLRRHDHVAWVGSGTAALDELAADTLADGARAGERLMFIADDVSPSRLAALPRVHDLLADGALQLAEVTDVYGASFDFDPAAQLGVFTDALDTALADGFTGLRVVADNTSLVVGDDEEFARWLAWEQLTDRLQHDREIIGICFFDDSRIEPGRLEDLAATHPVISAAVAPGFRLFSCGEALHVVGEIDAFDTERLARLLATAPHADRLVIDLGRCRFLDHQALHAFADHAERSTSLVLRNVPPTTRRVWEIVGRPVEHLHFG